MASYDELLDILRARQKYIQRTLGGDPELIQQLISASQTSKKEADFPSLLGQYYANKLSNVKASPDIVTSGRTDNELIKQYMLGLQSEEEKALLQKSIISQELQKQLGLDRESPAIAAALEKDAIVQSLLRPQEKEKSLFEVLASYFE